MQWSPLPNCVLSSWIPSDTGRAFYYEAMFLRILSTTVIPAAVVEYPECYGTPLVDPCTLPIEAKNSWYGTQSAKERLASRLARHADSQNPQPGQAPWLRHRANYP